MRLGLYSDALPHLDRGALLAWCAARGLDDVELGVGTWGPQPRPHLDLELLLREPAERDRLLGELRAHGLGLSAVNAAGNVLCPEPAERARAQSRLRGAVELAHALGVERVVTMSGCPGGRSGGGTGVFAVSSIVADDEALWEWQFAHEVQPYWAETSRWLAAEAPGVQICLELHAGLAIYNPATFARLAAVVGDNVGLNFDPSHFWWQGIDPLAVLAAAGDRVGHAHGKDTLVHADRVRVDGLLDHRYPPDPATATWHFAAVGDGHDDATWAQLCKRLRAVGFDGTISIEHEDPRFSPEDGVERSLAGLRRALA